MTQIFLALLPVFIVIMIGALLRRTRLVGDAHWPGVDQICYFVLFPAIIFKEIAAADFSSVPVWRMAGAMIVALSVMFALLLILRVPLSSALRINGAQFTSLFQGATRWHTFIAFAIVPLFFGNDALALAAISAATMTPFLNVVCIIIMSLYAGGHNEAPSAKLLVHGVLRNPFFLSSMGGVLFQLSGLSLPGMAAQVLDMIGRGALGLALLTVGAGLHFGEAAAAKLTVGLATVLKLLLLPLLMYLTLSLFGVGGTPAAVAILCAAVPTGSGAYVLARQMGGDAPLVANILTLQVICAALTIPLILILLA
ncbi:AEC family transporter [Taklimakanibacter deserti]|uniref:AEC family transporter n=1 Tax=Taklimakanibacter deserti TaxID=2267839 RepID=UPI000E647613